MNHKTESFNAKIVCLKFLRDAEDVLLRQVYFMGRHRGRQLEDEGSAYSLRRRAGGGVVVGVGGMQKVRSVNTVPVEQITGVFV